MPKINPLTYADVAKSLSYDPETGKFTWLVSSSRKIKIGDEAGCAKCGRVSKKTGRLLRYTYIRLNNFDTPAARFAWLLHYGTWPAGNVQFRDGDPQNLCIGNLREGETYHVTTGADGIKNRKMPHALARHYNLKRYYGMTGEEYGAMLADQKGLCAICNQPETAMFNGKPKVMHVDHDHATGQIRALLCGACNGMLGLAKDSPDTLRAAALYIEKHAAKIQPLRQVTGET